MATPTIANTVSSSYINDSSAASSTRTFGGTTHTSSGGSDRCMISIISWRSSSSAERTLTSLTWNTVSGTILVQEGPTSSNSIGLALVKWDNPAASTASAWSAVFNLAVNDTQIWAYNVEGVDTALIEADDYAYGLLDDGVGSTSPSVTLVPDTTDTLIIYGAAIVPSATMTANAPLSEDDERTGATNALRTHICSGVSSSSGSQSVGSTLSVAKEWITVGIALPGATGGGGIVIPVFMNQYRQRWN